jgi:hypothetical protein
MMKLKGLFCHTRRTSNSFAFFLLRNYTDSRMNERRRMAGLGTENEPTGKAKFPGFELFIAIR